MLLLECAASTLAADEITFAGDLNSFLVGRCPLARIAHVKATSWSQLVFDYFLHRAKSSHFDIVTVVGHSNMAEIQVAEDRGLSWYEFGSHLSDFTPKTIFLIACEGARRLPSDALFETIPTLMEIYGSPTLTTQQEMAIVAPLIITLLEGKVIGNLQGLIAQIANLVAEKGLLWRRTRDGYKTATPQSKFLETLFEEALKYIEL